MYICFHSQVEYKAPAQFALEADNDWTHFTYLHRKSHKLFQLIAKTEQYSVFLYRTRPIYPLPFSIGFIVFREALPEQEGYRQVYLPVSGGKPNVLESIHTRNEEKGTITSDAKFYFWLKWYWRLCPKLFCILLRKRMNKVWEEDFSMIQERVNTNAVTKVACAPKEHDTFRFDNDFLAQALHTPKYTFFASAYQDFYDQTNSRTDNICLETQNA